MQKTFDSADIKYHNNFSKLQPKKYSHDALLVRNLRIFILHETLHIDEFEGADFKYDNNFSKLQTKSPNKAILIPNARILILAQDLTF